MTTGSVGDDGVRAATSLPKHSVGNESKRNVVAAERTCEAPYGQMHSGLAKLQTTMTDSHPQGSTTGLGDMPAQEVYDDLEAHREATKRQVDALMRALIATFAPPSRGEGAAFSAPHSAIRPIATLNLSQRQAAPENADFDRSWEARHSGDTLNAQEKDAKTTGKLPATVGAPMGPPTAPSMTRQAHRARSAALAAVQGGDLGSPGRRPPQHRTSGHASSAANVAHRRTSLIGRLTDVLDSSVRLRYECPIEPFIDCTLLCLSDSVGKEVRAASFRLIRHVVVPPPWTLVSALRGRGLDLYIVRSLMRDSRFTVEKEQALKLVRWIMECGSGRRAPLATWRQAGDNDLVSISVIRAMSAAIDHGDDRLRLLYIETMAELALHDANLLVRSGGMRTLLNAAADPSLEILPEVMSILLNLADLPRTRAFFQPEFDLVSVLSGFTDASEGGNVDLDGTANAVAVLLRSWSGMLYMCLEGQRAVKSLILALQVNPLRIQERILDIFTRLFDLGSHRASGEIELSGDAVDRKVNGAATPHDKRARQRVTDTASRFNVVDSYLLLVVVVLLENGIIDALVHLIERHSTLTEKAMSLLQQMTDISYGRLPSRYTQRMHAMPALFLARFSGEAQGSNVDARERASTALQALDRFALEQSRCKGKIAAQPRVDTLLPSLRQTAPVDDAVFRSLMLEANVLSSKDFAKWNMDTLQTLFDGVLTHPKRLEEALRASKLVRRVLTFFHPYAMRYSALPNTAAHQRLTKLGRSVLHTLLANAEGSKFLADDRLFKELAEALDTDIMSEQRLRDTMAGGYFELLGVLTRSREGMQIMHQARLFTALYRIMERRRQRVDLVRAMLRHFDFTGEGHCRSLLARALAHRSRKIRVEAMEVVAKLVEERSNKQSLIRLLVRQLYDPVAEVRALASDILLNACTRSTSILETVVCLRPMLPHGSHPLLLRFLSTSRGLHFLVQGGYIDQEMEAWFNGRNVLYVHQLETLLSQRFSVRPAASSDGATQWDGSVPLHFYGELVKTPEGCDVLERKGHFADFARFIRLHADEQCDIEVLTKLKSVLWAVGHIGASRGGVSFLETEELVVTIIHMSERTSVASLRGTCFFVLGLIATKQPGAELLQDAGWSVSTMATIDAVGSHGFCVPSMPFLALPAWRVEPKAASHVPLPVPASRLDRTIMAHIASLGNSIITTKTSRALVRLKERHPSAFVTHSTVSDRREDELVGDGSSDMIALGHDGPQPSSHNPHAIELFTRALCLLETHPMRLSVRRLIWELFEVKMDDALARRVMECRQLLQSKASFSTRRASGSIAQNTSLLGAIPPVTLLTRTGAEEVRSARSVLGDKSVARDASFDPSLGSRVDANASLDGDVNQAATAHLHVDGVRDQHFTGLGVGDGEEKEAHRDELTREDFGGDQELASRHSSPTQFPIVEHHASLYQSQGDGLSRSNGDGDIRNVEDNVNDTVGIQRRRSSSPASSCSDEDDVGVDEDDMNGNGGGSGVDDWRPDEDEGDDDREGEDGGYELQEPVKLGRLPGAADQGKGDMRRISSTTADGALSTGSATAFAAAFLTPQRRLVGGFGSAGDGERTT